MKKARCIIVIVVMVISSSCVKDKPPAIINSVVSISNFNNVFIINEGPFQYGNGSISFYNIDSNVVTEDLYFQKNGTYLGNIVQSMSVVDGNYCLVVNNSGKIVFCDKSLKKINQITGLTSPRYVLAISNQKAYVSDLYANAISVVNLSNYTKTSSISCYGKTEKMALINNKAFVTNTDKEYLYVINTINDTKTDSVFVGINARCIEIDQNDKIWVLSSGENNQSNGRLSRINPINNQIENSFNFQSGELPNYLCFNKTKDTLYFINVNVYRMAINDNVLPSKYLIPNNNRNFYGLGVNPNDYTVYLSDALDYSQKSNIYIYNNNGSQKTFFKTAPCSNSFYFEKSQ